VKVEHVKDAAQDGSVKVFILSIVIFQWRQTGSRGPSSSPRVRACAATGARRRHIEPPSRTNTTAAAAAAASTFKTRSRAF